ncbi:MAG: biopolymer transporter ExbD [Armatimonadetes bacterium]|nr:biopolymer transporter ExbD [Armatimonadota bacterium]
MKFKSSSELKRTKIEIIPMIDTMFFLLVFFMLSSLALTKMMGLPVNLPPAGSAPSQDSNKLTLTIDKDQRIFLNKDETGFASLANQLNSQVAATGQKLEDVSIIINADTAVSHGYVVKCIDEARNAGITHFAIATQP